MNSIEIPWTKFVAAARELECVAAKHGIRTALVCPVGDSQIVALPVVKDRKQLEMQLVGGSYNGR